MKTINDEATYGIITKLGPTIDAEYPDSAAGNSPHSGKFITKPTVGLGFVLDVGGKYFLTSYVKKIIKETDNLMRFETNNSVYQLAINLFEDID